MPSYFKHHGVVVVHADLLIIDELPMLSQNLLSALDDMLRELTNVNLPWRRCFLYLQIDNQILDCFLLDRDLNDKGTFDKFWHVAIWCFNKKIYIHEENVSQKKEAIGCSCEEAPSLDFRPPKPCRSTTGRDAIPSPCEWTRFTSSSSSERT